MGGVPILVEEAHKGICDDEEEEGGMEEEEGGEIVVTGGDSHPEEQGDEGIVEGSCNYNIFCSCCLLCKNLEFYFI